MCIYAAWHYFVKLKINIFYDLAILFLVIKPRSVFFKIFFACGTSKRILEKYTFCYIFLIAIQNFYPKFKKLQIIHVCYVVNMIFLNERLHHLVECFQWNVNSKVI